MKSGALGTAFCCAYKSNYFYWLLTLPAQASARAQMSTISRFIVLLELYSMASKKYNVTFDSAEKHVLYL